MKKILISIKPKYVAEILNHRKTLEIRKSCPKCELPCEVYIYCTKNEYLYRTNKGYFASKKPLRVGKGTEYTFAYSDEGMVVAKFTLNKVETICCEGLENGCGGHNYFYSLEDGEDIRKKARLDEFDLRSYLGTKLDGDEVGYAWHIDNLVIFDKPKELKEFKHWVSYKNCNECPYGGEREPTIFCATCSEKVPLTNAPQSWCYCEVEE